MTLQEAIDFASVHVNTDEFGIEVVATISMHDEVGDVLVGAANGLSSMFRRDLPLLNWGTGTIVGGVSRSWWQRSTPGFSTRSLGPGDGAGASMRIVTASSGVGI